MTDRGLYARWLYQEIVALGWHPLMRVTRMSKFREAGLDVERGGHGAGPRRGPTLARAGAGVPCQAPAAAELHAAGLLGAGSRGAWFVLTDLPPSRAEPLRYGMRGWDRARIPAAQERRLAMASDADDLRPWPRGAIVASAGGGHGYAAVGGEAETASEVSAGGRDDASTGVVAPAGRSSPVPVPPAMRRSGVPRGPNAPGQHLRPRIGGVDGGPGLGPCDAETPLETRTLVGNPDRDHNATRSTTDTDPEKPSSEPRWGRVRVRGFFRDGRGPRTPHPNPLPQGQRGPDGQIRSPDDGGRRRPYRKIGHVAGYCIEYDATTSARVPPRGRWMTTMRRRRGPWM